MRRNQEKKMALCFQLKSANTIQFAARSSKTCRMVLEWTKKKLKAIAILRNHGGVILVYIFGIRNLLKKPDLYRVLCINTQTLKYWKIWLFLHFYKFTPAAYCSFLYVCWCLYAWSPKRYHVYAVFVCQKSFKVVHSEHAAQKNEITHIK